MTDTALVNIPKNHVAYFSMEIGIKASIPTYSGGLGVLAGDSLKSSADLCLPMSAVTLLYRKGYFNQKIDSSGTQLETPVLWEAEDFIERLDVEVEVEVGGRKVKLCAWKYLILGATGHELPVYFLDSDLAANYEEDRKLTSQLYGGDERYRLGQEIILGEGGVKLLSALGFVPQGLAQSAQSTHLTESKLIQAEISTYHMNEGHSALLTLGLLRQKLGERELLSANTEDVDWVRRKCVFTTHTPVSAGHDQFPSDLVIELLGEDEHSVLAEFGACPDSTLNMSHLALSFCRFVNGVAKRHGEVSQKMFPETNMYAITNGIHAAEWASDATQTLFDKRIPLWRQDNNYIRNACELGEDELLRAHQKSKVLLCGKIEEMTGVRFDPSIFTLGFARRAAEYKRANLIFTDPQELQRLAEKHGQIQIVYAGKAHPKDEGGKKLIKDVVLAAAEMANLDDSKVSVVYLENYDMDLGRLITSGVDVWLNNPVKPLEASGTSGMKAALNGIPNLSTLDGWWVEGHIEGVTGWEIEDKEDAFGADKAGEQFVVETARALYAKLDNSVLPVFYAKNRGEWVALMRNSIAINGSFFNTHRMMSQYRQLAYRLNFLDLGASKLTPSER